MGGSYKVLRIDFDEILNEILKITVSYLIFFILRLLLQFQIRLRFLFIFNISFILFKLLNY